tara:strand:- start:1563 stop:2489 length:927 start_codon:yes stop_codon:yes gene_type:complete
MPEEKKKRTFEVGEKKYAVRQPTIDEIKKANEERAKAFNEALSRGDLLRDQLELELRKRKLWNDDREAKYQTLRQEIIDGEYKIQKGGIRLNQAKSIALEMSGKRGEMIELLSSRTDLDSNTCEGRADAARFNYLFACCLVYDETGKPYFPNNVNDYLKNQDDEVALAGATEFYYLISNTDNVDDKLPEIKFLKKFNFVDDESRLIDKDGRLINADGKHIDDDGNFIEWNEDGSSIKVDPVGRPVNNQGDFEVKHVAFLDDSGKEIDESIYEPKSEEESKEEKPKRRRKKNVNSESEPEVEAAVESDS